MAHEHCKPRIFAFDGNSQPSIYIDVQIHRRWKFSVPIRNMELAMNVTHGSLRGISAASREALTLLNRTFNRPFDASQAADMLQLELGKTRRLLAALADGGWLARVRHGWYITVPLEAAAPSERREDPWVVAATLFAPCYIGGWSACEHWGFFNQLFSGTYVVAARKITPTDQIIQDSRFKVRSIQEHQSFGTRRVWRQSIPVEVSDPHRTIIDIMDVPGAAGGALPATQALRAYFGSELADEHLLCEYGDRLGRGALYKRLGYLVEREGLGSGEFVDACRERVSKGISSLDPSQPDVGRIVSRWQLKVNVVRLASSDGS